MEVRTADEVIVIDNDEDTVQFEVPVEQVPPLSIKLESKDIPRDIEAEGPRRSTRIITQRKLFSPKKTGTSHDAVGFVETEGEFGEQKHQIENSILTHLTEEHNTSVSQDNEIDGKKGSNWQEVTIWS